MQNKAEPTRPEFVNLIQAIRDNNKVKTQRLVQTIRDTPTLHNLLVTNCQGLPPNIKDIPRLAEWVKTRDIQWVALGIVKFSQGDPASISRMVMKELFQLYESIVWELLRQGMHEKVVQIIELKAIASSIQLLIALKLRRNDIVEKLVASMDKAQLFERRDYLGFTELGFAAAIGDLNQVVQLIDSNENIADANVLNSIDEEGHSPLMWAARTGHVEIIIALLEAGADPDIAALDIALEGKNEEVVLVLLANEKMCRAAKERAFLEGHMELGKLFQEAEKAANDLRIAEQQVIEFLDEAVKLTRNRAPALEKLKEKMESTYFNSVNELVNDLSVFLGSNLSMRTLLIQDRYAFLNAKISSACPQQSPNLAQRILEAKARSLQMPSEASQTSQEAVSVRAVIEKGIFKSQNATENGGKQEVRPTY